MPMKQNPFVDYMLGIDIGTTKVCATVAHRNERHVIEVMGLGVHPCSGLSATGITNVEDIVNSISHACSKALSHTPGLDIRHAVVGLSGSFMQSQNSTGTIMLSRHGRSVGQTDIQACIQAAVGRTVPKDFEVVHSIPRLYRVDDTQNIREPLGMEGGVLESDIHLVIAKQSILKNLRRCVNKAGFKVEALAFQPIASSFSVLSDEEKETGVALVDIGGRTTSVVVFYEGRLEHSETIAMGGEDISLDINHYFQTPYENADSLKRYAGTILVESVDPDERIEIVRFKNRRTIVVKKKRLCEVMEARVEHILEEVIRLLRSRDLLGLLYGGIVLTGGTALMEGLREKTQEMTRRETHVGYPNGVVGFEEILTSPSYATIVGLLHYGYIHRDEHIALYGTGVKRMMNRMVRWVQETF